MKRRSNLSKFNSFLAVVLVITVVATVFVINKYPVIKDVPVGGENSTEDTAVIDEFKADTYGGVEFKSIDDVVAYYNAAYDKTKAMTKEYIDGDGKTQTWYAMLGEEDLQVKNIMIEGKENSMINGLVPGIVGGLYSPGLNGLSPSCDRKADGDIDSANKSFATSRLVADDLLAANVKDNGDGTITLVMQPKRVNMSEKGMDAQGHMFNSLGDISGVVEGISVLEWASGTTEENCIVDYYNGTATVTIDTASGEITTADYHMEAHIAVNHATVTVIKDKSASLLVTYDVHFPASAEYLSEYHNAKVK